MSDKPGGVARPLLPSLEEPEKIPDAAGFPGIPDTFPEGTEFVQQEQEEQAQTSPLQNFRDTLDQSVVNSAIEVAQAWPSIMAERRQGTEELEPHRAELTKDIPLHLHDQIMQSGTLAGARARADRIREDNKVMRRLAQQTGVQSQAIILAGGLLDADLPLILATGGTLAAGKTALGAARAARALGASTSLSRVAGDLAIGASGGALSGAVVGAVGTLARDDYDVNTLLNMVIAGAATGGVINPIASRVLPDRDVWQQAAEEELEQSLAAMQRDFQQQAVDPDSSLNRNTSPVNDVDLAETDVPPAPRPEGEEGADQADRGIGAAEVGDTPETITESQIAFDKNVPKSIVRNSIRYQNWKADRRISELYAEDTANPLVRMLVGGSNYEVKVPFTDKKIPVGQIAGTVFTLAQRDFTRLINSKSPASNFVAAEILESASGLVRQGSSSAVLREMFHSAALVHSAKPLRDFRAAWMKSRGLNPIRMESHRAFSAELRLQAQRRYLGQPVNDEYVDILNALDQTHAEMLRRLQGVDEDRAVLGAREIEHRPGYFRYAWDPERFRTFLQRAGGNKALVQAFTKGYMQASGLDKKTARSVAKAVVRRFRTRGVGRDAADTRLLDLDSRSGIEEVLQDAKLSQKEIDRILQNITVNTQQRTKKGYLKQRVEVDLSTPIPGSEYRIVDLMADFERSLHQYVGDASGAAALAHKGIRSKAEMNELIDTIVEEQFALGENAMKREEIEAIFSQFTGGAHQGFMWNHRNEGINPLTNVLLKSTRASLLQRTGLTQVMDAANGIVGNGLARYMEPIMAELNINKPGVRTKAELQDFKDELDSIGVIAGRDHDIFAPHLTIDESEIASSWLIGSSQKAMGTIERWTHFVSGQVHVTKLQQQTAAAAITSNVIRTLAGEKTNLTPRMLRDLGLEENRIAELTALINDGTINVSGARVNLNNKQWPDDLKLEFGAAMVRGMHQQVQRGLTGETSVWMNTDVGKLLSVLKTFSLVATQKQMARNLMIGGKSHFVGASAWQLGFAYAVLSLAMAINGTEMSPFEKGRLAAAYTPNIGTIPMITDPMTSMLGFDDLNFSPYGRYTSYLDTPVFEVAKGLAQAPGGVIGTLSGEGTYDDMKNARTMFFLNWYGMKQLWESM